MFGLLYFADLENPKSKDGSNGYKPLYGHINNMIIVFIIEMEKIFKKTDPDGFELLVLRQSLNLQQWKRAIKPGGSLYEGKINSTIKKRMYSFDRL